MIIEAPKRRPPFITLLGEPGLGKTTLACMFPDPIIIRLEDGIESVPEQFKPSIMPVVTTFAELDAQIRWVFAKRKEHKRKTIIIDSITKAESMLEQHLIDTDPNKPQSINQACGGYGAGPKALGGLHGYFKKLLDHANKAGDMTIVVIAHAATDTVEPPDGENYSRYVLRLGKHSMAPWVDDVDLVGFLRLQQIVRGAKEGNAKGIGAKAGKVLSGGVRELVCHTAAANVSKNRFGIRDAIEIPDPMDNPKVPNPLLAMIPYYVENGLAVAPEKPKEVEPEPEPEPEQQHTPDLNTEMADGDDYSDAPSRSDVEPMDDDGPAI